MLKHLQHIKTERAASPQNMPRLLQSVVFVFCHHLLVRHVDRITGESMTQNSIWIQAVRALGFWIPGANKIRKECSVYLGATERKE